MREIITNDVAVDPNYVTGEVVKVGDIVKIVTPFCEDCGKLGTVVECFIDGHGKWELDVYVVGGGSYYEMDEVKFIERMFELPNLKVGDTIQVNKSHYITYKQYATVTDIFIDKWGTAKVRVVYEDGQETSIPQEDIRIIKK